MNAEAAGTPGGRRVPWGLLGSIALAVAVGVAVFVLPRAKKEPVRPPAVEALAPAAPAAPPAPEPVVVEPSTPAPVEPAAPVAVETPVPDEPPPAPAPQARVERPAAPQSPRGWRGDGQGLYLSARPAIEWSAEKNVLWAAKMPSWSNSSPAVVGGRVFVCAESSTLVCVDAGTGTVLWKRSNDERDAREAARPLGNLLARAGEAVEALRKNIDANPGDVDLGKRLDALTRRRDGIERRLKRLEDNAQAPTDGSTGYSSPSPVSDGENIWAMFGTGVAACYDMDGERRWIALLDRPNHGWGYSASPILADGKLIVSVTDVMALDAASGEEVWRVQSGYHFGTPLAIGIGGVGVLVTPEGQLVRLADGKVLASGMGGLPFNSPIVCDGVMYGVGYDDRKAKAWRLPAEADVAAAPELLWEVEVAPDRYYTSPVCYEGLLYAVTAGGVLNVINAEHGSEVYRRNLDLGGTYFASPTIAGGYLFLMNDGGTALVLEPGPRYVEVARSPLEAVRSTPVFAGNRTYLNYLGTLRCVQGGPVNPTDVWIGRFWASPSTAVAGQPVTLTWDTVNADAVRIEPGVGPVKGTGSATVSPAQTTTYTLTAEGPGGPLDARAVVTTLAVRNADVPAGLKPGLSVAYYELGETASLPDFTALRPYKKDRAARVEYAATGGDFATSGRADNVGAVFTGYVEAPRAGVYTFYTESDDGSALYLGGARIVDNDGLHGMLEKSGTIALGPGMHALRVEFFERGGGAGLVVRWEGPGIGKAVMPDAALQHAPEGG